MGSAAILFLTLLQLSSELALSRHAALPTSPCADLTMTQHILSNVGFTTIKNTFFCENF